MITTYNVGLLVDDSGAILNAPVVTVANVFTKAGTAVPSPGVVINGSGTSAPISFDYDAEANGEAFVVLAVSQASHTVTSTRATVAVHATRYRGRIDTALAALTDADITIDASGLTGSMSVYQYGATHIASNLIYTVALSRTLTTSPFSFDRV